MKYWILNLAESTTQAILFVTWYFGHTGWSHFRTDQTATQNCHLTQYDVKFQWSVLIFQNRGFHVFVLTKFILSLFNPSPYPYLTTVIPISNDFLTFLSSCLFVMERVLSCNQSKWLRHSFLCSIVAKDDQYVYFYNDFLFCFTIIYWAT